MKISVYTAEQIFDENEYSKMHTIKARSHFYTIQVDSSKPSWVDGRIMLNNLEDEVQYIQYG